MIQWWRRMTFLHWRYRADEIQRLLPDRLRVETFDGSAWVGLLPFAMYVRPPGLPALPWLSRFPETNVRTYVRGPDGKSGIFFFSLEATRLPAILTARAGLGLPYRWSAASVRAYDRCLVYRGRRRWPGPPGVGYHVRVRVGPLIPEEERTALDHFLTARYRLYSTVAGRLVSVEVEHPPWPLFRGTVLDLSQDLLPSLGVPVTGSEPLVHASPGVRVRIGVPRLHF
jgi:uncharacterized protein YqjF (DUF2071 family)